MNFLPPEMKEQIALGIESYDDYIAFRSTNISTYRLLKERENSSVELRDHLYNLIREKARALIENYDQYVAFRTSSTLVSTFIDEMEDYDLDFYPKLCYYIKNKNYNRRNRVKIKGKEKFNFLRDNIEYINEHWDDDMRLSSDCANVGEDGILYGSIMISFRYTKFEEEDIRRGDIKGVIDDDGYMFGQWTIRESSENHPRYGTYLVGSYDIF
jgi:hypothetical protein